jgi:hypothetical protein
VPHRESSTQGEAGHFSAGEPLMAMYYFHLRTSTGLVTDDEGADLPDLSAVYCEALMSSHEFVAESDLIDSLQYEITDAAGDLVLKIPVCQLASAWGCLTGSSAVHGSKERQ